MISKFSSIPLGMKIKISERVVWSSFLRKFSTFNTTATLGPKDLEITFSGKEKSYFGHLWLRDHCKCSECWHPETKQRLLDTFSIPKIISPKQVQVSDESLSVVWIDHHKSEYPLDWLKKHSYNPSLNPIKMRSKKICWDSSIGSSSDYPKISFSDIMRGNVGLANWLTLIDKYGFCEIEGVPVNPTDTEKLARRISFIRETHYGSFWDFTSNLAHGDTAYTNLGIGSHTDTTYFTDPIGLQLFHLLEHNGEGGHTLLVDGFNAARQLKAKYPKFFDILTNFNVPTHSAGDSQILIQPTPKGIPMIRIDPFTKDVYQIRYNHHDRSVLSGQMFTAKEIEDFYEASRAFDGFIRDKRNEFQTKMKPGSALIVDNWRVLHGRTSFTGKRRLCGAYLNWDDYKSRWNTVVERNKAKSDL